MNDQQIYHLMSKTPNIRAVQIADALDAELVDVSASLRSLVEVGDVVQHSGMAPNGRQTQMYNLSADFKRSRDGAALMAAAGPIAQPASPPVPITAPASAQIERPVSAEQQVARRLTKVELAVAFLKTKSPASDAEMRVAIGLDKASSIKAYVGSALRTGQLICDEAGWRIGEGIKPLPKHGASGMPMKRQVVSAVRDDVFGLHPEAVKQLSKPAQALAAEPPASAFRCGLWSDGVLELQRDGERVAQLTQGEGEQLAAFMTRMLGAAERLVA